MTDREYLIAVAACKKFRPYILGKQTMIISNHTTVKWLMNKPDPSGHHARWQVILSEFDYEIRTHPGIKNGNTDALSRLLGEIANSDVDDEPEHFGLLARITVDKWLSNPWYKDVYLFLETLIANGGTK